MKIKERKKLNYILDRTPVWELIELSRELIDRIDELIDDEDNLTFKEKYGKGDEDEDKGLKKSQSPSLSHSLKYGKGDKD